MKRLQFSTLIRACLVLIFIAFISLGYAVLNVPPNLPILASGAEHALIVRQDGTVWVWGQNDYGQLGGVPLPGWTNTFYRTAVRETNILGAASVAAGEYFSIVLKLDGSVLSFGNNGHGQLGLGDQTARFTPSLITNLSLITSIAAGQDFSMAVLQNGTVKSWGHNQSGQLGIGSKTPPEVWAPTNIIGLSNIFMVACGSEHALALSTNGNVWSWGLNSSGQLGDNTKSDRFIPVSVTNLSGIIQIAAGEDFSMALKNDGTVFVWGEHTEGRLGVGTTNNDIEVPTRILNFSNICQIAAGSRQGYALDTNGFLWAWGHNGISDCLSEYNCPIVRALGFGGDSDPEFEYSPAAQDDTKYGFGRTRPKYLYIGNNNPKHFDQDHFFSSGLSDDGNLVSWGLLRASSSPFQEPTSFSDIQFYKDTNTIYPSAIYPEAYYRGINYSADYCTFVIPLDFEKGIKLDDIGGNITNTLPFFTNNPIAYHYNLANSSSFGQTNLSLRVPYQNPIVAFGSAVGGSVLYTDQSYRFICFAGIPTSTNYYPFLNDFSTALKIDVYNKTDFTLVGTTNIPIPYYFLTNGAWSTFLTNGLTTSLNAFGLKTIVSTRSYPLAYGVTNGGVLELSHIASDLATNYIFAIKIKGMNGNGWVSISSNLNATWQPLYTVEFDQSPPWSMHSISGIQFAKEPLPPFYDGKSLEELLTNSWTVTNVINLSNPISSYTNLDQSPELRRHPTLDALVESFKHDPIAIARFVQNEIELTDAIDWFSHGQITEGQLNLGGINRSALGVYLERQGSPAEQCALLLYLLRQAGVPAVYAFPPNNGIKMLDARVSKLLRVQLENVIDPETGASNTNSLISLNYPWVVAYINNKWVHLFPWIKDTEIIQGPNVYDFMPDQYNNATKWVMAYLHNDPNIIKLGNTNDPVDVLFQRFIAQQLLTNTPGLSFDELGVCAVNRKKAYNSWDEFPRPTWVASTNLVADSYSDSLVTGSQLGSWNQNIIPIGNAFNTIHVSVSYGVSNILDSGSMRVCDVNDRAFLIYSERSDTNNPNSAIRQRMTLAAYQSNFTNVLSFTDDVALTNRQSQSYILPSLATNMTVSVTLNRNHVSGAPEIISRSLPISKGDLNALCLNFGRVSTEMLEPLAQNVWNTESWLKSTPAATNWLTADTFQGPLMYLMGMSYYEKVSSFIPTDARLHGRSPVTTIGIGMSKLVAQPSIPRGPMVYVQPVVDMAFSEMFSVESPTSRSDSGEQLNFANDAFNILAVADASSKEHDVINSFFQQSDAVSTVRLLQLAEERHQRNPSLYQGISTIDLNNLDEFEPSYVSWGGDYSLWTKVRTALLNAHESQAIVTPGSVTNNTMSYLGSGVLIIGRDGKYSAYITGAGNGGFGADLPDSALTSINANNIGLVVDWVTGQMSISTQVPDATDIKISFDTVIASYISPWITAIKSGFVSITDSTSAAISQEASLLEVSVIGTINDVYAAVTSYTFDAGNLGAVTSAQGQHLASVEEPVDAVSGEFYVDSTDLSLVGPMPLSLRRNYTSFNLADNEFGLGWKMGFMPYMGTSTNKLILYAAEPSGAVLVYEQTPTNSNVWLPTLLRNPQISNNSINGIGSTANLLLSRIVQTNQVGITNYYLYSPNGDVRYYQTKSFVITNVADRTRPYLTTWTDSRGNSLKFTYGTNAQDSDYGQFRRVDSSSGAYMQFSYDAYGHILEAFSGDGRTVEYKYDTYGDLVNVTLPDASEINYEYLQNFGSFTNVTGSPGHLITTKTQGIYSTHLLTVETKPDGRRLANAYDAQRRVVAQASTVGVDLNLVTNATFAYFNNFALTNAYTNTITGHTLLYDVFNNVQRYDYTNGLITKITDPLQQTIDQYWYTNNAPAPGYSRSLWKTKDKRGLTNEFQYDSFGNVTNVITTGNLTGASGTQIAITSARYDTNNLPLVIVDAIGNSNVFRYDATFDFLPGEIVSYKQGQAICTNKMIYGNATDIVVFGNKTWTNTSYGLCLRSVRAYLSPDAATNECQYNGSGFITNEVKYTGNTDPTVSVGLSYNGRGELFQRIDAAGRSSRFDYDGLGRVISQEVFEPGQSTPLSWLYTYYDHNGEPTWIDGPQYNPEDYVWADYDGDGRKVSEIHWRSRAKSDGTGVEADPNLYAIISYEYDAFGNLTKQTDPVGNYTLMLYDALGQMTKQTSYDVNGNVMATAQAAYEAGGKISISTNSLGGVTKFFYTTNGLPAFTQNPDGSTHGWRYDLIGRATNEFLANGSYWETTYDDVHRTVLRQFKDSSGTLQASTTSIFDCRGNLTTNITAEGGTFFKIYDELDRVKISGGPATVSGVSTQQISTFSFDASGQYMTNQDLSGRITSSSFDAAQRPLSIETRDAFNGNALVSSQTTSYSADHHSVTTTIGTGNNAISSTTFVDGFNNPVLKQMYPDGMTTVFAVSRYDAASRLIQSQDELGKVTSVSYDGLNRVSSQTLPDGATIALSYDQAGNLTNRVMPGGLTWQAVYNSANQVLSEQLKSGSSINRKFTYQYFSTGPNIGLPQTIQDVGRSVTATSSYDAFSRLAGKSISGTLPDQNMTLSYLYDRRGLVTNLTQAAGVAPVTTIVQRSYDGYGQLTNENVTINSVRQGEFNQTWNNTGRRGQLSQVGSPSYGVVNYGYRVDGLLNSESQAGQSMSFLYADNGFLTNRVNPWRTVSMLRDGQGRLLQETASVGLTSVLVETCTWRADSTLASYAATRSGTGAWNDARNYQYNTRNQLTTEPIGLSTTNMATNSYSFDAGKLGVLVGAQWTGGRTNYWLANTLNGLGQITQESWNGSATWLQANGQVTNADVVTASVDSQMVTNLTLVNGKWLADLVLPPGVHTLLASAHYPAGNFSMSASSTFTVNGTNSVFDLYDSAGYVTNRIFASGKAQVLTWDGVGRLVSVVQRDAGTNGFNWTAIYDGLGRRLRTIYIPITSNTVNTALSQTNDSFYDPLVEFQELAVDVNGQRTWKLMGLDLSGGYGSLNGVGGLEATVRSSDGRITPVLNDYWGNVPATIAGTTINWYPTRMNGYGPVGGQSPVLSLSTPLADTLGWRSRRMDPTGYYYMGARHYDPVAGHFLSPDPLGHTASMDLYSFVGGDPVNRFDANGRFSKAAFADMDANPSAYEMFDKHPTWLDSISKSSSLSEGGVMEESYQQNYATSLRINAALDSALSATYVGTDILDPGPITDFIKDNIDQAVQKNGVTPYVIMGAVTVLSDGFFSDTTVGLEETSVFAGISTKVYDIPIGETASTVLETTGGTTLRLPATMTDELAAYQKAIDQGLLVKTRSSDLPASNARAIWEEANGPVPDGFDVDHIIQRQFGGTDELSNLQLKSSSLNRSEGSKAMWLNKSYSYGTIFDRVELIAPE